MRGDTDQRFLKVSCHMKYLERARWVTDKYILAILGVYPLFLGFHGYSALTKSKFWFFAAVTGLWLALTLGILLLGLAAGERYSLSIRPAHLAVGVFLALGGVSAVLSDYGAVCLMGANRYDGYLTWVMYGCIFFGVSLLGRPRRRYVWAMAMAGALNSLLATAQLFGLDPFSFYPAGTNYYDKFIAYNGAFLGTMGNVGMLSAFLCLAAPLTAVYAARSRKPLDRVLFLPAALCVGMLVACDVDAGMVALAGCVILSVPVVLKNDRHAKIAAAVCALVLLAGLAVLYWWPGRSGTLYEMSQVLHGHFSDSFGSSRGQIWKQGWHLWKEHPWLGAGPGTAALRFNIQWYSDLRSQTVAVTNAHNAYLGIAMNNGLLGLGCYLAAIACSCITWFRRRKRGAIFPALGSAMICYLIQDFFGLALVLTFPMLWVIWGLLESRTEKP